MHDVTEAKAVFIVHLANNVLVCVRGFCWVEVGTVLTIITVHDVKICEQ